MLELKLEISIQTSPIQDLRWKMMTIEHLFVISFVIYFVCTSYESIFVEKKIRESTRQKS